MSRLIDADALLSHYQLICNGVACLDCPFNDDGCKLEKMILESPIVDAGPVVHGHWVECKLGNGKDGRKCSDCLHTQEITGLLNYCPICGARMDEVTE